MSETPRSRREKATKYAFYPDATTRAYQERLRRGTNVKFADFLRAAVARIAVDADLEAEILAACGGGYIPGTFDPSEPFVPPTPLPAQVEANANPTAEGELANDVEARAHSERPHPVPSPPGNVENDSVAATGDGDSDAWWDGTDA